MNHDVAIKIVVADSDPAQRDSLAKQLSAEGHSVATAPDGESAIFAFEEHAPDLVLLERSLPGLDGSEVCQALKARSGSTFIPVIFLAPPQNADGKTTGEGTGADDVIVKPIVFKELVARINSLRKIQGISNRDQRKLSNSTYRSQKRSYDEVMKVVADNLGSEEKTLYRFSYQGLTGYLAIDGFRIVHARLDELTGRAAIEKMLVWPAEEFESLAFLNLPPNVDIEFEQYVNWWSKRLDLWRFIATKLPAKQTILEANALRDDELPQLEPDLGTVYRLFDTGLPIDQAARKSPLSLPETFKTIGELFYRGLLLRSAAPDPAELNASPAPVFTAKYESQDSSGDSAQKIEALEIEILTLSGINRQLNDDLAALHKRREIQSPDLERILNVHEQAAASTAAQLAELNTAMVALKRRYASRLKDIATKSNDGIMDSVVEQLSMDLQDAHTFAVTVQNSKLNTERQVAALREECDSLHAALEEATRNQERLSQQKQGNVSEGPRLHQLQAEVQSLKAQLSESSVKRQALQEQLQGAPRPADKKILKRLQDEADQLRTELADANQQKQALRDQLDQSELANKESKSQILEEQQAVKTQLAEANKSRKLLQQKMAQAAIDEASKIDLYEQEIAQLNTKLAEAGENSETAGGSSGVDPLHVQLLEHNQAELQVKLQELQESYDQAQQTLNEAETKLLFMEQEVGHLRPSLAQTELSLKQFKRKFAEQEALIADHPLQMAALEAVKRELENRLADALEEQNEVDSRQTSTPSEDSVQLQNLEEEFALIKSALTESMVKSDRLESQLATAADTALLEKQKYQTKLNALEQSLREANRPHDPNSESPKSQQLESELAFVKAKFAELQSSAGAQAKQHEKASAVLKTKLEEAKRKLDEGAANSGRAQPSMQNDSAAAQQIIAKLTAENAALAEKLEIVSHSANKTALLSKAQDLADKFHKLKTSAAQQAVEIETLQAALAAGGGGELGEEYGAVNEELQAQVQALTQKVDALRMTLLERDEEIVDLTVQVETFQTAGN